MNFFYSEIGVIETWSLFLTTIALVLAAHWMAFRQAVSEWHYEWKSRPLRSALAFFVRHEFYYLKQVPVLIASVDAGQPFLERFFQSGSYANPSRPVTACRSD
ncbi:MAG: hypothetical protein B7Z26_00210 [Asticcacaulis sp. 32-58-5]|nr:MAG: hypothetical protein B7Z26_00210 [Asticcacaulis sp. 32-58-5]